MKKILIFGYTLEVGGAEKILIDTLKFLSDKVEIDLFLLEKKGELLKDVPKNIKVFSLKKNKLEYLLFRFISLYRKYKINRIYNKQKYDVVIGYLEGRAATWVSDIKNNTKKIAWIHTDVSKNFIGINTREAKKTYNKIDKIICVSEETKKSFCKKYRIPSKKVDVIYNFINEEEIINKSKATITPNNVFTFVNVAKMRKEKGQERLIKAANYLKNQNYTFKIQLIGDGPDFNRIKEMVDYYNVSDCIELLGLKTNPYPYIKNADFFVLPSLIEGYSVVIKEALLLQTKILSTDVGGQKEMLENGKYGIIVPNEEEKIIQQMENILNNPKDYEYLKKNLKTYKNNNDFIKEQIINLLNK